MTQFTAHDLVAMASDDLADLAQRILAGSQECDIATAVSELCRRVRALGKPTPD